MLEISSIAPFFERKMAFLSFAKIAVFSHKGYKWSYIKEKLFDKWDTEMQKSENFIKSRQLQRGLFRNRRLLLTTLTELRAIAIAAIIGERRIPKNG